jgi:ElaB/YqjD/DUF883 family membrane-anchored ribosome-binding protein
MNTQVKKDLEDALLLINKVAREEKEELKQIINEKYEDVRGMFTEKIAQGTDTIKHTITVVDKKVKENPWTYVATAAVSAFLLGLFLNRSRDK